VECGINALADARSGTQGKRGDEPRTGDQRNMRKFITTAMVGLSLAVSLVASMSAASAQTADKDGYRSRHYAPGYEDKAYNRDGW
jgi:hypothetical protein